MHSRRHPPINLTNSLTSIPPPIPSISRTSSLPTPMRNPAEIQKSLSAREESLTQRIAQHDEELRRLGREIRGSKPGSRTRAAYKKRAARVLKQKHSMEKRLEHAMDMSYKMGAAADAVEGAELTKEMQLYSDVGGAGAGVTSGELEEVMEEMKENVENVEERRLALEGDLGLGDVEFDEEEMGKELDEEVRVNREREGEGESNGRETEEGLKEFIANLEAQVPVPCDETPLLHDPPANGTQEIRGDYRKGERRRG